MLGLEREREKNNKYEKKISLAWDARPQGSDRALLRKGLGQMHATLRLGVANHCLWQGPLTWGNAYV